MADLNQLKDEVSALLSNKFKSQTQIRKLSIKAAATKAERKPKEAVYNEVRNRDVAVKKQLIGGRKKLTKVTKEAIAKREQIKSANTIAKSEERMRVQFAKMQLKVEAEQAKIKAEQIKIEKIDVEVFKKEPEIPEDEIRIPPAEMVAVREEDERSEAEEDLDMVSEYDY